MYIDIKSCSVAQLISSAGFFIGFFYRYLIVCKYSLTSSFPIYMLCFKVNTCLGLSCSFDVLDLLSYEITVFVTGNIICSEISFVWYYYIQCNFILINVNIINLFTSFILKLFLGSTELGLAFLSNLIVYDF